MKGIREIFALAIALSISACGNEPIVLTRTKCSSEANKERISWVQNCIRDANPKSDEEPEDWIRECERTSARLFCVDEEYKAVRFQDGVPRITLEVSCKDVIRPEHRKLCQRARLNE